MTKYQAIYEHLKEMIINGQISTGQLLPSENDLMKIHDASRDTVRKALNLLVQNGFIQKNKGKGSIVIESNRIDFPVSGVKSFKELALNRTEKVETIVKNVQLTSIDEKLAKILNKPVGTQVYKVERVRQYDNEKVIYDIDYLIESIVPNVTEDIAKDSLYEYIERRLNLVISYANKEITVEPATKKDQDYLDLHGVDLVVVVKSLVYLEDTRLFQYTISRHRPDKFRFVDFARRN